MICDPPYGIAFKNHAWDRPTALRDSATPTAARGRSRGETFEAWTRDWAGECLRLLRPGGYLTAFGAPRTFHRLCRGVEDAGLELRDVLLWLYGTGMPKSRRLAGGRGTALKPAYEPILLARKQPHGPIARTIATHGTGALNIDACRVGGRWPANVLLSHTPGAHPRAATQGAPRGSSTPLRPTAARTRPRAGHPSRLFYCPKASRRERNAGCDQLPARELDLFPNAHGAAKTPPTRNPHPTVKPLALMRWLIRLTTPDDGLVLDPFCGSGTTGCATVVEHRRFLGIEREEHYAAIARARMVYWSTEAEAGRRGVKLDPVDIEAIAQRVTQDMDAAVRVASGRLVKTAAS